MKSLMLSAFAVGLASLALSVQGNAQGLNPPAPVTRILGIGKLTPGVDLATVCAILPREVKEIVKQYLDGKIDQWFSLADQKGVAFLLNMTDAKAAQTMLEDLPLGRAHSMGFELTPLAPLRRLPGLVPCFRNSEVNFLDTSPLFSVACCSLKLQDISGAGH